MIQMQSIQFVILLIGKIKNVVVCYSAKVEGMDLYQAELMDHYRHPRNKGELQSPDFSSGSCNPSCGDSVYIMGNLKNGIVTELRFQGSGCVISQAAASMLTQSSLAKTHEEIMRFDTDYIRALLGIELGPMRIKCALLPLEALQKGLAAHACNGGSLC